MKVAVVDDEKEYSENIKECILKYCREHNEQVNIEEFSDGIDIVSDYTADYDVIFLDVAMKHMDGLKTAELIRKMDKHVSLFFVTGCAQYAINGYEVEASGYFLKPLDYELFERGFGKCIERIKSSHGNFLTLSTDNGMDRVAVNQIVYIESQNHVMHINTLEKTYNVYETLRDLESKLPSSRFTRCNNCYLVNLTYVTGVHGNFVCVPGAELKISRSRRKSFLREVSEFFCTT